MSSYVKVAKLAYLTHIIHKKGCTDEVRKKYLDTLISLGPAFIKIGQVLAMKNSFFPTQISDDLKVLYHNTRKQPPDIMYVISSLPQNVVLTHVTPIASGCFASVYRG